MVAASHLCLSGFSYCAQGVEHPDRAAHLIPRKASRKVYGPFKHSCEEQVTKVSATVVLYSS